MFDRVARWQPDQGAAVGIAALSVESVILLLVLLAGLGGLAGADPRRERGGGAPACRAAYAPVQPVQVIMPWPLDPRQTPSDPPPGVLPGTWKEH